MKSLVSFLVSFPLIGFHVLGQDEVPPAFEIEDSAGVSEVDPFDPLITAPRLIRTQVEHIEISHKDLTRLLMQDKADTADAKDLRMKVQAMVDKDEAKILDTQVILGRSGEKQRLESVEEFIYPTEYEPPGSETMAADLRKAGVFPYNPATPTAFEVRNLGSSLETEPIRGSDENEDLVDLRFLSELTWHTGNQVWIEMKDSAGNIHKVQMPDFYELTTNASITCISGQYVFVSALSPKNSEGKMDTERKVMVFVKCVVLPVVP